MRLHGLMNSKKREKRLYKCTTILDMEGAEYGRLYQLLDYVKATNYYSDIYPETAFKIILINTPLIVRGIWTLVKFWLHPITAAKVHLVGGDYEETFKENGLGGTIIPPQDQVLSWDAVIDELHLEPQVHNHDAILWPFIPF